MAIAAYQLPVARDYAPGMGMTYLAPPGRPDRVEISAEARRLAKAENIKLWGEVRHDEPRAEAPDAEWEITTQQWSELMEKVFGEPPGAKPQDYLAPEPE